MTMEELEEAGLLLPREYWGKNKPKPAMNIFLLVFIALLVIVSMTLIIIGDGNILTFIGIGGFLFALFLFTVLGLVAINRQNKILEEME